MLFCHAAVMADVRKVKMMKIKASLPKIGSFPRCLTSYFSIIKVFIFHSRNTISSPISLNQEFGQLRQAHVLCEKSCAPKTACNGP